MIGSKLTLHVQLGLPGWVAGSFAQCGIRTIKLMDPPLADPLPGVRTIGRVYVPDNDSNGMIWRGAAGADEWWNIVSPAVLARRWVWAWEGPNEPQPFDVPDFRRALNAFTTRLAQHHHAVGTRLVGINAGVGHPTDVAMWAELVGAVRACDYLGLHEYNAPRLTVTGTEGKRWWVGRYQMGVAKLRSLGVSVPPIIIGEHGIDLGVWTPENPEPRPALGWQAAGLSPRGYADQLIWADRTIYADPIVEAVCVYTAAPEATWRTFEVTAQLAGMLAEHIRSNPPQEPAPAPISYEILDIAQSLPKKGAYGPRSQAAIQFSVLHHSGTPNVDTMDSLTRVQWIAWYHIRRWGWPGIGFHYVIARDGTIYQTNPVTVVSSHTPGGNLHGVGVCLLGSYTQEVPPEAQVKAAAWLLKKLGKPWYDHKHWKGAVCPGIAGDAVRTEMKK